MSVSGILLIDKAAGSTSAGVVAEVRRLFDKVKAGHAGTLDPMATGLLPVLLGEATAFTRFLPTVKTYQAEVLLGLATATDDAEGEILAQRPLPADAESQVREMLPSFVGEIEQTAPRYSALKHRGRPMYYYARNNISAPPKHRRVRVYGAQVRAVAGARLTLTIQCGSGFYVRALARDIGERLGCGAHLSALRRLNCASFEVRQAVTVAALSDMNTELRQWRVMPVEQALRYLPPCELPMNGVRALGCGQHCGDDGAASAEQQQVCFFTGGCFAGVGLRRDGQALPQKMLSWTREDRPS